MLCYFPRMDKKCWLIAKARLYLHWAGRGGGPSPASAPGHSAYDLRHLVKRKPDRADRRCGGQVRSVALDIARRVAKSRVEPHIRGREVRQMGLADAARRQRAQTAVDAAHQSR